MTVSSEHELTGTSPAQCPMCSPLEEQDRLQSSLDEFCSYLRSRFVARRCWNDSELDEAREMQSGLTCAT